MDMDNVALMGHLGQNQTAYSGLNDGGCKASKDGGSVNVGAARLPLLARGAGGKKPPSLFHRFGVIEPKRDSPIGPSPAMLALSRPRSAPPQRGAWRRSQYAIVVVAWLFRLRPAVALQDLLESDQVERLDEMMIET